jgi:multicomponent Na+:H+ antiporter subunit C
MIETPFVLLTGLFFASAVYLMLSRHIIRIMLGVALLGNAVNLLLFTSGRLTREIPPVIAAGADTLSMRAANPLPQALILTAIVISFSFFSFLMVLSYRAWQALGTDDTETMRFAEPADEPMPPLDY